MARLPRHNFQQYQRIHNLSTEGWQFLTNAENVTATEKELLEEVEKQNSREVLQTQQAAPPPRKRRIWLTKLTVLETEALKSPPTATHSHPQPSISQLQEEVRILEKINGAEAFVAAKKQELQHKCEQKIRDLQTKIAKKEIEMYVLQDEQEHLERQVADLEEKRARVDAEKAKAASEADAFKKQLADYKAEVTKPVAKYKHKKRRRGLGLKSEHGGHQYDEEDVMFHKDLPEVNRYLLP